MRSSRCIPQPGLFRCRKPFWVFGISGKSDTSRCLFLANTIQSLSWLVRGAAQDVLSSSDESVTVWDLHEIESQGDHEKESFAELAASELGIGTLGSGSDYTAFLQRYGVASVDMSFGGAKGDPVYHYHSIYDSFHFMDKFLDPGYHKHVDMAKVMGLALLRLSDSLVLPINVTQYSVELSAYLNKCVLKLHHGIKS